MLQNQFSIEQQYQEALQYLTPTELSNALNLLKTIQTALEHSISD